MHPSHVSLFVLMTNRTQASYIRLLEELVKVADEKGYKLEPKLMLSDYELAEMNSFKHVFKNIKVRGCHFHYTQAIYKNIQAHKLVQEYFSNPEFKSWLNYLKALPFARPENVVSIWNFSPGDKSLNRFRKCLFLLYKPVDF